MNNTRNENAQAAAVALHSPAASTRIAAASLCLLLAISFPLSTMALVHRNGKEPHLALVAAKKTVKKKAPGKKTSKKVAHSTRANRAARTARLHEAFIASSELRPMAQQLSAGRSSAAYAGVTAYAQHHTGDAAAAAYLALGHAYLIDKHYSDAVTNLHQANLSGDALDDYSAYLSAQANLGESNYAAAIANLKDFSDLYPDSILVAQTPELEATAYLGLNDATSADRVLAAAPEASSARPGFLLAQAQVKQALGQPSQATQIYKRLLLSYPLSSQGQIARARLTASGAESTLSTAELRSLGDAFFKAGRYAEAAEQYHALTRLVTDPVTRNSYAVSEAACDYKLKRLSTAQAEALANTNDDNGARRLYLLMELARNRDDLTAQQDYVEQLRTRFPSNEWLAEALFSSGNMYLLRKDYPHAVSYYSDLAHRFPDSTNAATAHWRAGWWSYRQGQYAEAARIFDEQLKLYPGAKETASALYWRGRVYELREHRLEQAASCYQAVIHGYQHFFYAQMARERLSALGARYSTASVLSPEFARYQPPVVPHLETNFPEDDPHLVKAHLLANAGLTEYIPQEIAAVPGSSSWSAIAEARIYASFGENFRAMRVLKRAIPYAASAPIKSIPLAYWRILFPEPYWETILSESARNGLDPYLVASLIRQESEFNPAVISHANAYGLMQLLPSVGKQLARQSGMGNIESGDLLDPVINIKLGTRYFKQLMDRFGGVPEYALAAYNAGETRVVDWQSAGPYTGVDEYVESIPFSETRDYVQAILRNQETYKSIDDYYTQQGKSSSSPHL